MGIGSEHVRLRVEGLVSEQDPYVSAHFGGRVVNFRKASSQL